MKTFACMPLLMTLLLSGSVHADPIGQAEEMSLAVGENRGQSRYAVPKALQKDVEGHI